jgi:hypothetical protein
VKDSKSRLEQISEALHAHDLRMMEWRHRFLMHQQYFKRFEILREIHVERMVFFQRVLKQLQEQYHILEEQARWNGWE